MEGELLSLKWNNHRATFLQVVGDLRRRSEASYADATLACNGKFYPVHRLVLSSCSDYFNAIFDHTTCKSPVIVLKDIESKNLEYLLDYMYIGEVNVRQTELGALVGAAECLKIKGLAVPDDDFSKTNSNSEFISKNRNTFRNRSCSPQTKRRRLSKYSESAKHHSTGKKNSELIDSTDETSNHSINEETTAVRVKSEPIEHEVNNSSNDNVLVSHNSPNYANKVEAELLDSNGRCIEKEEPAEINEDTSSDVGGTFLYDNEEQSWKSEEGFNSDIMEFMSDSAHTKASCSSQANDQNMCKSIWNCDSSDVVRLTPLSPGHSNLDQASYNISAFNALHPSNSCHTMDDTYDPLYVNDNNNSEELMNTRLRILSSESLSYLHSNIRKRIREKKYECPSCDYKTISKSHLERHFRKHTGEKPFVCDYCEYRSADKTTLRRHILTHMK